VVGAIAVAAPGDPDMAAEIAVVVAKIVLGLASSSVRTEVACRDNVVVHADHGRVALDRSDRHTVRRRGTTASLGDLEAQRDRMRFGHGCAKHL
jgi:hypothetical protein